MRRRGRRKVFHAKEELNRCLLPCAKRVASKRHVAGRLGAIEDVYGGLCLWVCAVHASGWVRARGDSAAQGRSMCNLRDASYFGRAAGTGGKGVFCG